MAGVLRIGLSSAKASIMHRSLTKPFHWPTASALMVFLIGTWLAALQGQHIHNRQHHLTRERFGGLVERVVSQLGTRLKTYELGLRSTRGVVMTAGLENMTRLRFVEYIQSLNLAQNYPGARGFGLIRPVLPEQETQFLASMRQERPDFEIYSFAPNPHERWVVQYIEPEIESLPAIGVDIASDPRRYRAALESIQHNQPTLTPPITLRQNSQDPRNYRNSFLFLLPVYRSGMPIDTPETREQSVTALVYAPLIISEVLADLDAQNPDFSLSLFDSENPEQAFYNSVSPDNPAHPLPREERTLKVYGREWRILVQANPSFIQTLNLIDTRHITWGFSCLSALAGIFLYIYLISSSRRKQALLDQSRLAAIVASSSEAIIGRDLKDRITSWNRAAEQMFGYSAHEVLGKPLSRLIVPTKLWAEEADLLSRIHCGQSASRRLTQALKRSGEVFEVEISLSPIYGSDGCILGSSRTVHDLTEQNYTHQQLEHLNQALRERTAQAEAANQSKSEFLANMSHEIRTPMNAILGLCQLLKKQPLSPVAADMLNKIQVASHSLLGIINDILDLSKIEARRLELEHVSYSLDEVLDNLATIMAAAQGNKNLELVIMPPPPKAQRLKGDPLRLGQILINLVSNAIKFTQEGSVVVEISIQHSLRLNGSCLSFAVKDTGIGIPPEKQQAIFAAFTQADSSTSRTFGGTGLGLTICQRLASLMRGSIQLHSALGQGSTFTLEIPFEPDIQQPSEPLLAALTAPRLLILDHHPNSCHALACLGEQLGWQAKVYASTQALLHDLQQTDGQADLLIINWHLPEHDGVQISAQIRKLPRWAELPIILTCSLQEREQLQTQSQTLINSILTKPITQRALYTATLEALEGQAHSITPSHNASSSAAQPQQTTLHGLHILVVDDSEINREVAHALLQDAGAQITLAESAEQALNILQHSSSQTFQLVLMDIQMPQMDGYEAAQHIRAMPQFDGIPIIALTAGICEPNQQEHHCFNAFLAKPFEVTALIAVLNNTPCAPPALNAPISSLMEIQQGQKRFGNRPEQYARHLEKFIQEYDTQVLAQTPQEQLGSVLHRMKGIAANLGLVQLAQHCAQAEQPPFSVQNLSAVQKTLANTEVQIREYLSQRACVAQEQPVVASLDASTAQRLSQQLHQAVTHLNSSTLEGTSELLDSLAHCCPPQRLAAIQQAIEDFEFEAATQALQALAKELGLPPIEPQSPS